LVRFSGTLTDVNGKPLTGSAGVTFALYSDQQGGAPLWIETQSVALDRSGRYSVQLGSTASQGLPTGLFTSGEARWLGVQPEGQAEQPRVLLLSVPYALKAADAETLGGFPAAAFVLAAPASGSGAGVTGGDATTSTAASATPMASSNVTTTGGTVNTIPLFSTATNIQNSLLTQTSTTAINVGGKLNLPATAAATKTAGTDSRPLDFVASSFDSTSSTALNQTFQWQAEPAANDTASPSGTLNLLYGLGATVPSETGLKLSSKGVFTFAVGQTFPGTGTITGITTASGSGLSGGGTTGTLSLKVPAAGITNAMLAHPSLTLTPGGGMAGGGAVALGGTTTLGLKTCAADQVLEFISGAWACTNAAVGTITGVTAGTDLKGGGTSGVVTLNVDTTEVPQLSGNNAFTGNNAVTVNNSTPALTLSNSYSGTADAMDVYPNMYGTGIYESGGAFGVYATGGEIPLVGLGGAVQGVYGGSATDSNFTPAIFGVEEGTTTQTIGVFGETASPKGAGVYGQSQDNQSGTGSANTLGAGVWGDGGSAGQTGVVGTADDYYAGYFENNGLINYTLESFNGNSNGYPFAAFNQSFNGCYIDALGDILCTGAKNALVPIDEGQRKVALAAIESPKNWFEDLGSERLSNGAAVIALEPEFAQTVNTDLEYHVFLTPKGDCKGLYVANETASSFEVHELGGGSSSVSFDYRIVALRKNFENIRLADHTNDPNPWKTMKKRTPTHLDINRLIPPKREAQLVRPIAQPARK
jgi:hypothetical protein